VFVVGLLNFMKIFLRGLMHKLAKWSTNLENLQNLYNYFYFFLIC